MKEEFVWCLNNLRYIWFAPLPHNHVISNVCARDNPFAISLISLYVSWQAGLTLDVRFKLWFITRYIFISMTYAIHTPLNKIATN